MKAKWLSVLLPLLLISCFNHEPREDLVQRPIHDLSPPPESKVESVSMALWPEEVKPTIDRMVRNGWWVHSFEEAAEEGTFVDDVIKHKVIVIFQRYGGRR
jgi:hypothetical protein